ncbi:hypothetical protein [Polaromonas eurypsychrophila]|uniref:Uncharacterized protein n=1 Tax=Polaromonas eurypsychrophila TaxID=1614635 RepID=A0A916SH50_9BURK|nr:hypothetical protein [Polaromonas eurypsychrophila]GGA98848.1 hypothetical protein GCM10011496_19900 [Polaromonas eurypsychrophila]
MTVLFREQLLAASEQAMFPAEKTRDPQTGEESLDPASAASIAQIFDLFGISALTPEDEDFDRVINTTCTLAVEVAAHVQELDQVSGVLDALEDAADWHADYRAYVGALWRGDREGIAKAADRLKLTGGMPNGSLPLDQGPLA